MKYHLTLLILNCLFFNLHLKSQVIELSSSQKIEDLNSLYNTFKLIYPYFDVNQRKHNIDWIANYDIYHNRISKTKSNSEFLFEINKVIDDLNCGHVDMLPTLEYDYFYKRYKSASLIMKCYKRYIQELKKGDAKKKNKYWKNLYKELYQNTDKERLLNTINGVDEITYDNVILNYYDDDKIAVLKIKSFQHENIKHDKQKLVDFYNNLNKYETLIIDIQGNGGGSMAYWMNWIVPYLITDDIIYSELMAFKNVDLYYQFTGEKTISRPIINTDSLKLLPNEVKNSNFMFRTKESYFNPYSKSPLFSGKIYLLVDNEVYSSSESFAIFCKKTKFANVVGIKTGGDGIGGDPFIFTLPNSGISIRYPGEMGLNPDGSSNEEVGTVPELILKGESKDLRLKELLMLIN